ncbi:MAG: hypothetical protein U1E87_08425 [Alphaproteobacteria bacterium]
MTDGGSRELWIRACKAGDFLCAKLEKIVGAGIVWQFGENDHTLAVARAGRDKRVIAERRLEHFPRFGEILIEKDLRSTEVGLPHGANHAVRPWVEPGPGNIKLRILEEDPFLVCRRVEKADNRAIVAGRRINPHQAPVRQEAIEHGVVP